MVQALTQNWFMIDIFISFNHNSLCGVPFSTIKYLGTVNIANCTQGTRAVTSKGVKIKWSNEKANVF